MRSVSSELNDFSKRNQIYGGFCGTTINEFWRINRTWQRYEKQWLNIPVVLLEKTGEMIQEIISVGSITDLKNTNV